MAPRDILHLAKESLFAALSAPDTVFVLGAGASAPDVPTINQIPDRLAPFAADLSGFPAGPQPESPLRDLIRPLIERANVATTFADVWPGMMTAGTVAVLIEDIIQRAHRLPMPQYEVFQLFSVYASVISFNWDGLAQARCPQITRIHPHGCVPPRTLSPSGLIEALNYSQEDDTGWLRDYVLNVAMPGEEELPKYNDVRERVFSLWRKAGAVVVIGYSFGLGSDLRYDRAWCDAFEEAMRENSTASVHVLDPNAEELQARLGDRIGGLRVFEWPFRWKQLSRLFLTLARATSAKSILELRDRWDDIIRSVSADARAFGAAS